MAADDEHIIQREIVRALRADGFLVFAIPNGGRRNIVLATRLKAEGVMAGVPDLFVADYGGFFLEVKTKTGKLSAAQDEMAQALFKRNFLTFTVRSVAEAQAAVRAMKRRNRIRG